MVRLKWGNVEMKAPQIYSWRLAFRNCKLLIGSPKGFWIFLPFVSSKMVFLRVISPKDYQWLLFLTFKYFVCLFSRFVIAVYLLLQYKRIIYGRETMFVFICMGKRSGPTKWVWYLFKIKAIYTLKELRTLFKRFYLIIASVV